MEAWHCGRASLEADIPRPSTPGCMRYEIPGVGNRYIMLHMLLEGTGNGRKIGLSVSDDGKSFTPYDADLIPPGAAQSDYYEAAASRGAANKLDSDSEGDYVEYQAYPPAAGEWNITVRIKKHNSRGKFRLYLLRARSYVGAEQDG